MKLDKNITAIISGGASGMGAATARALSDHGIRVALLDLNFAAADQLAKQLNGSAFECDVTNFAAVESALKNARTKYGTARICINCAGIVHGRRMVNQQGIVPLAEWKRVIDINVMGTFNVMSQAAQAMMELEPVTDIYNSQERGIIINTASIAAFEGQIGQTAYSASKAAIVGMTLPAARELASFGIRVMTIAPGLVDTPMFGQISTEARATLAATVPFPKRLAQPEEFARLVLHIIENSMLNGEVIRLDGAIRLQPK